MSGLTMRRKPIPMLRESKPNMGRRSIMATRGAMAGTTAGTTVGARAGVTMATTLANGTATETAMATQTDTETDMTTVTEMMISCADFDTVLAEVLHRDDLPPAARHHLDECPECAAAVNDYEAIAQSVRDLPPLEAPVPDLWPQIREALRREGVIHTDGRNCTPAPKLVK